MLRTSTLLYLAVLTLLLGGCAPLVFTAGAGIIALLRRRKKENSNDSADKARGKDGA